MSGPPWVKSPFEELNVPLRPEDETVRQRAADSVSPSTDPSNGLDGLADLGVEIYQASRGTMPEGVDMPEGVTDGNLSGVFEVLAGVGDILNACGEAVAPALEIGGVLLEVAFHVVIAVVGGILRLLSGS